MLRLARKHELGDAVKAALLASGEKKTGLVTNKRGHGIYFTPEIEEIVF